LTATPRTSRARSKKPLFPATVEKRTKLTGALKKVCLGYFGERLIDFKEAVTAVTARMDHAFGNALMVKVEDFLAKMRIFNQRGSTHALREATGVPCCVVSVS
jgi:hypothetical protein